jgi:hypothetical protein
MGKIGKQAGPVWGIFPKLLLFFLVLSITPLIVLGYMANKNMAQTGMESTAIAMRIADFLYERDNDNQVLATFKPDPAKYERVHCFYAECPGSSGKTG